MSDTIREKIIKQIAARAAVITTTNGYNTDMGLNVFRAVKDSAKKGLPACIVHPRPETAESNYGSVEMIMPVRIEGIVAYGSADASVVADQILGDLIKCFSDPSWDRRTLVTSPASPVAYLDPYDNGIKYKGGGTDEYPNAEDLTVGASVLIEVYYSTKLGNPYEQ